MITQGTSNNGQGPLKTSIGASAVSMVLETGYGALFPSVFPYELTIEQFDSLSRVTKREIVNCTGRTGDVFTIVRSYGYCPSSYSALTQTNTAFSFDPALGVVTVSLNITSNLIQKLITEINLKLATAGGLRTGFAPNKIFSTDSNGNEEPIDAGSLGLPTGSITQYAGSTAPSLFLICDGAAVSRTTYAQLFTVLGTTYGVGDGSTTFNIPNLKGRAPVGYDVSQAEFNTLGKTGGAKTHTLSTTEMPTHHHSIKNQGDNGGSAARGIPTGSDSSYGAYTEMTPGGIPYIADNGGGQAHNNLQPYITLNYIIKT